ncbi:MAG: Holliday junction resolvase RuvX [Gammaproteobacteria bacterium]|nr:Holliday junction resolvase RuvX [Gammaproteobacteria bacterium]
MPNLTALGFDFGLKRIGVAVGQTITYTAAPLEILSAVNGLPNPQELEKLIKTWRPNIIVVGMPYNEDGSSQELSELAEQFAQKLKNQFQQKYNLTVVTMDERYSSLEAQQKFTELRQNNLIKKGAKIDHIAACVILERWLSTHRSSL